jgi:phytoene synthase
MTIHSILTSTAAAAINTAFAAGPIALEIRLFPKREDYPPLKPKNRASRSDPAMQLSQAITRKSASNLALAFVLLPKPKREGMSALYAVCREVDDISDDDTKPVGERRAALAAWRQQLQIACGGGKPDFPVIREFQRVILEHRLPYPLLDELVQGVEMDLDITRYATYQDLELYCYRVASVVGLLSIEIFGYQNPRCRDYAIYLGKALQLTNILRDVQNDADRGRIYLPLEALAEFKVSPEEILGGTYSERFHRLAQSVAQRARAFYLQARQALPDEDRRSMASAELMGSVYWQLLEKLERQGFDVFGPSPPRLNKGQKLFLILRTWYRLWTGALVPNYGVR